MDSRNRQTNKMHVREYYHIHKRQIIAGVVTLVIASLWITVSVLRPLPPHTVIMATGIEGNAYHEFGKRYREILAREGIELQLRPTAGSLENLQLLRDPRSGVSVSFLQGGTTSEKESPDLSSLGAVFYEPLWFFYRDIYKGKELSSLRGKKISVGPEGSGSRALSLQLLAKNGIDQRISHLLPYAPNDAASRLVRGDIDALLMLTSWENPLVQRLINTGGIELASFPRTDAYVVLYPFLHKVVVPAGVGDLVKNRPPQDEVLLAPMASLIVRTDLHPAIQYLLLDAAAQVHSGPGIFRKAGQFPKAESVDLPLSDEARQFYRTGPPFLQRHLPFWLAVLIGRLLVLLIPVIGIMYPLVRFLPLVYNWSMRRRIYKLYAELRFIEQGLEDRKGGQDVGDLVERLNRLEEKAQHLKVAMSCVGLLYRLRDHIDVVRGLLSGR